ncbi:MAG: phospholipase D family protein [Patescibacteria group bacterium]
MNDSLLEHVEAGTRLCLTIGIDLGGTSRDVLEELLRWNCEIFIFHNTISRATFHPKVYLFQGEESATLFIGSNNLTDGGFYTNYEAATRYDFVLPADSLECDRLLRPLNPFLEPNGATVQRLDLELIQTLVARGELPSEAEARARSRNQRQGCVPDTTDIPASPFGPIAIPFPPLLPRNVRGEEPAVTQLPQQEGEREPTVVAVRPPGVLVWRKTLPQTDALQVNEGSHHVGGVRLTQARFENPLGQRIDQTTYFRNLFADYQWERESGRHRDQEHTFVPIRIIIRGRDYGVRNFEISHKPSGEARQDNYTTILRWGHQFNSIVLRENLTGTVFSLYETAEGTTGYLIEIV